MSQPTFETECVTLVPAVRADVDALWTIWRDPDVRRYLFDDQPVMRERAAVVLDACLAEAPHGRGLWTIRERGGAGLIGCAGLMPVSVAEYDPALAGLVEPIVALAPAAWHRGHAVAALRQLVAYAFGPLDLARLAGATDVPNEASHRMLTRAGFVPQRECPGPHYRIRTYLLDRAKTVQVRAYRDADAPILMRLFHDTVHTVCRADYDAVALAAWSPAAGLDPAVWRARFAGTRPWVAVDEHDVPLGFLELDGDGHVDCCYVDHRRQRRGVGSSLMQHALAVAAATGIRRLTAEVSITARPFFAHHDFVVVRPQEVQRNGASLRNYVMERTLTDAEP